MEKSLKRRGIAQMSRTVVVLALILFVSAGSVRFWQAWVYLGVMIVIWSYVFAKLIRSDPALMERRMQREEPDPKQKFFQKAFMLLVVGGFVLAGLDFRFGWSRVPLALVFLGQVLAAAGYWLVYLVMKANSFAGSTIRVENEQRVISHGPYAIVRHPMYTGMTITAVGIPLALGSYVTLPVFALLIPVLIYRLIHEERTLRRELPGYAEYCQVTRSRLVPWIW